MPIPNEATVPDFPGARRLLDLFYSGHSFNAIAEDPVLRETMLAGIEKERSRSWKVFHTIDALVTAGMIPQRSKGDTAPAGLQEEVAVILGDLHCPYQDDAAIAATLQVIQFLQPDRVIVNGDASDFYQISRFDKAPSRQLDLQQDLDVGKAVLRKVRQAAPNARMSLKEGNHDARLKKWRCRNPEMSVLDCLKLESLIGLDEIHCDLIGEHQPLAWHSWTITHGNLCRKRAGSTAQAMIDNYGTSGVSNHIHRLGYVVRRNRERVFEWIENGCLCRLDMDYTELADWEQGFTVLTYRDAQVWPEVVRIDGGRAFFRGRIYGT